MTAILAILAAIVLAACLREATALLPGVLVLLIALGVGWNRSYLTLSEARAAAIAALSTAQAPGDHHDPLPESYRRRLESLARPNLVVFSRVLSAPFAGSGEYMFHYVMPPVDLSRSKQDRLGNPQQPIPFGPQDLHRYIATSVRQIGLADVTINERLYVRGDTIGFSRDLWPDRSHRPGGWVDRIWLDAGVAEPAEQARTYLCLEKSFSGGLVYVTLFVRAGRQSDMLTLEIAGFVLPPPLSEFGALPPVIQGHFDAELRPLNGKTERSATLNASRALFLRRLLEGPWQASESILADWFENEIKRQETAQREGKMLDCGAVLGLREVIAQTDITDYFNAVDLDDSLLRMQRGIVDCLGQFLVEHNIDTAEFDKRQEQIINNHVGDVYNVRTQGGNQNIGRDGTINSSSDEGKPRTREPSSSSTK